MNIDIEDASVLQEYSDISAAFTVKSIYKARDKGCGHLGIQLELHDVDPYIKDTDEIIGTRPIDWVHIYDLTSWRFVTARDNGVLVGGLAITDIIDGRALYEDFRINPDYRGRGLAAIIHNAGTEFVRSDPNVKDLFAETQGSNVWASDFTKKQGWDLVAMSLFKIPNDIQLLWRCDFDKNLSIVENRRRD